MPAPSTARCKSTTSSGKRCKNRVGRTGDACHLHARHTITALKQAKLEADVNNEPEFFDKGLYYPFIDVRDEGWLKTTVLYWDEVSTIVPDGYTGHRRSKTSQTLTDIGFLKTEFVEPGMRELEAAAEECLRVVASPEVLATINDADRKPRKHPSHNPVDWMPEAIHDRKLAQKLRSELERLGFFLERQGSWIRMPGWIARYYMTVLAAHIARRCGLSLLTDDPAIEGVANRAARGDYSRRGARVQLGEGLLATTTLRTIQVDEKTSLKKLLKFKEKHDVELGRLRTAVRDLSKSIAGETDVPILQKRLHAVYKNQVFPAVEQGFARS